MKCSQCRDYGASFTSLASSLNKGVFLILILQALCKPGEALDNGLGVSPPRGWRSWDAFLSSSSQAKQQAAVDALIDKSRKVDGVPTSLYELGYNRIGLDDGWQDCGKGVNGTFHTADGRPLVKNTTFPSLSQLNSYAKNKGVGSGWYLNTCDCCERGLLKPDWPPQMHGDVNAVVSLGFDGLKLDSCGPSQDLAEWAMLLNKTGKPVLLENCFDNASYPYTKSGFDDGVEAVEDDACPMNMFRSGGDMRADWPLMLRRLQTIVPWLRLSRPGCWAYLDMLEVGNPPGGTGEQPSFENIHSWRAHFGAWAITSSPLILSFDLTNKTKLDKVWDFITNREALAVNHAWAGEAGRLINTTYDRTGPTPVFARPCSTTVDTQKFQFLKDGKIQSFSISETNDNVTRCLSVPGCSSTNSDYHPTEGSLQLAVCENNKRSQQWNFTDNALTNIQSLADGGCMEIDGCSGSTVDTDYGCKPLPTGPLPCTGCCNMAWTFTSDGRIRSGMSGRNCLQVDEHDETTVIVGPCTGSQREYWKRNGLSIESALWKACIDNNVTSPLHPQYGPLELSPCGTSKCDGDDKKWIWNSTTGQLVSAVKGAMGESICAEVQQYFNHYSPLLSVSCADIENIPKSQKFNMDATKDRFSVDVRFNATQQRSPGMQLCIDIDYSALPSSDTQPGSRLISQVFSKKISPNGTTAILFINADTNINQQLSVNLTSILPQHVEDVNIRNVWEKLDLPKYSLQKHHGIYTTSPIPPQDSAFLIFRT
eukprot:m.345237 g.345237  ORF g.345237 m.345237 type:complete len:764 (+) comp25973_c0_seq1:95-2386(+)